MIRPLLGVIILAAGTSAVIAQQDPIKARQELMKANSAQTRIGAAMVKGEAPFDLAKAKSVFAVLRDDAAKLGNKSLWPESTKTGDTAASPKIWENMEDFSAKLAKLQSDAKAAEGTVKDLESFKSQFTAVTRNCGGCHQTYRLKKS